MTFADPGLTARLAASLDVEGKIPRALEALGPVADRDVLLVDGDGGLRAAQLESLGARVSDPGGHRLVRPRRGPGVQRRRRRRLLVDLPGRRRRLGRRGRPGPASRRSPARRPRLRPRRRLAAPWVSGPSTATGAGGTAGSNGMGSGSGSSTRSGRSTRSTMPGVPGCGLRAGRSGRVAGTMRRPRLSYNLAIYHRSQGRPRTPGGDDRGRGLATRRRPVGRAARASGRLRIPADAERDASTAAAGPTGPRRSRLTPFRVTMAIALIGSLILLAYGLITRDDNQLRILTAGGYVVGIVLAILALSGAYAAYRRAAEGQEGRAFGYALLGGLAAVLAGGCAFAAASILALVQHDLTRGRGSPGPSGTLRRRRPPSSRGPGRHPFKVEIRGSNPLGGTSPRPTGRRSADRPPALEGCYDRARWRSWASTIRTIVKDNVATRCDGCLGVIEGTPWRVNLLDIVSPEAAASWIDRPAVNPGPFQFHPDPAHVRAWMADKGYLFCRRGEVRELMRPGADPRRAAALGPVRRSPPRRSRVRSRLTGRRRRSPADRPDRATGVPTDPRSLDREPERAHPGPDLDPGASLQPARARPVARATAAVPAHLGSSGCSSSGSPRAARRSPRRTAGTRPCTRPGT